jgi:cytochrome c oxidase assembly factor CtaG
MIAILLCLVSVIANVVLIAVKVCTKQYSDLWSSIPLALFCVGCLILCIGLERDK